MTEQRAGTIRALDDSRRRLLETGREPGVALRIEIRDWILDSLITGSPHEIYYRVVEHDAEADLVTMMKIISDDLRAGRRLPPGERQQAIHDLKRLWRFLVRRYALVASARIWWLLAPVDAWYWSIQRLVSMLLPRLGLAVLAGVVAILGSGELADICGGISVTSGRGFYFAGVIIGGYLLDVIEVQRRAGREAGRVLLRAAGVSVAGWLYAVFFTWIAAAPAWRFLSSAPAWTPELSWVVSASAFLIAHIVQLFWLDASHGEPI